MYKRQSPTSWTKAETITKDATEKYDGSFSAIRNGGTGTKDMSQTISGITPGDSYTISLWYKVTSGDASNARIWSYWKAGSTNLNDNAAELRGPNNTYLDNNENVWTQYTTTITAPATADSFYFEVRSYSNSVVNWDNLSFIKNTTASILKNSIAAFTIYPNPITSKEFTISSTNNSLKKVSIYTILGRKVVSVSFTGNRKKIKTNNLATGIYILKVIEGRNISTKKITIQ